MKDWQVHNSRLFMRSSNVKHQSVYTKRQEPVFEAYEPQTSVEELFVALGAVAAVVALALAVLLAYAYWPRQCDLLRVMDNPSAYFQCLMEKKR